MEEATSTRMLRFLFVAEVGDNTVTPTPHGNNTGEWLAWVRVKKWGG
jgi:hypothetical protein